MRVQSESHLPSDVVLGQLVTDRIGLENGIVLSFKVNYSGGSGAACSRREQAGLTVGSWSQHL